MELTCLVLEASVNVIWSCLETKAVIAQSLDHLQEGETLSKKLPFKKFKEFRSIFFEVEVIGVGKSSIALTSDWRDRGRPRSRR